MTATAETSRSYRQTCHLLIASFSICRQPIWEADIPRHEQTDIMFFVFVLQLLDICVRYLPFGESTFLSDARHD